MLEQAPPLYALRMMSQGHFTLAKFAMPDFTVEATYNLIAKGTGYACDCPASARVVKYKPCKHQRMLPFMLGACNTDRFYEPESRSWCQPLAPDLAAAVASEAQPPVVDGKTKDEAIQALSDLVGFDVTDDNARPPLAAEPPKLRRRV